MTATLDRVRLSVDIPLRDLIETRDAINTMLVVRPEHTRQVIEARSVLAFRAGILDNYIRKAADLPVAVEP